MTKRVVLIGHPVAHSLSGAMQQAALDHLGIDARYELWDRSPAELAEAIAELRTEEFLGANITIPHKERVVPHTDRQADEAHVTGAVNTLTKEGRKLVGHNTDVAGFKIAMDKLVGRQKMPRHAVVLGAGGGSRAVVYGLIREGFQRIVVFNRHLHRSEGLVKHFSRSAAHMDLRAMPWHESIIESELSKTKVLINATSIGLGSDESPIPAEILPSGPHGAGPHLREHPPAPRRGGGRVHHRRRGDDAAPPGRGLVHALDRAAGPDGRHARGPHGGPGARDHLGGGRAGVGRPPSPSRPSPRAPDAGHGTRAGARVDRFRFLTAGESHGPMLGVVVEGVPAGLALTEDDLAVDLARRQRGYGRGARQAIEQDRARIMSGVRHGRTLGSPILLEMDNRDWANWTRVMQVGPLSAEEAAELATMGERGQQACPAHHRGPARPRGPCRRAQVRLRRRPQRAGALVGPRDRGPGRGRRRRPRVPAGAGDRGLVVHRRGGRRGRGPGPGDADPGRGRRLAAPLPGPGRRGGDDRPHRRGAVRGRHRRRRVRGGRPRRPDRPRQLRPLGPAPGRGPGGGGHGHQHRQGRGAWARVRADAPVRVAGPRRDRGAARRTGRGSTGRTTRAASPAA